MSYSSPSSFAFSVPCSTLAIHKRSPQTTFAIVFTVATSTVLAKTITVVLAFKVTVPDKRMRSLLVSGAPNFIIPICTVIQMFLCGIWIGTSPPFVDAD
ncbi:hypothetical protein A6R68_09807, partial [Neotoma lepida]